MSKIQKRFGLGLEIVGLSILLIATAWDAEYSGWWDKTSFELQFLIQEEANLSLLYGVADAIAVPTIDDRVAAKQAASAASERVRLAAAKIIEMREQRNKSLEGQAADFAKTKFWLLIFGAIFILLGKVIFFVHPNAGGD
ncbi:hypothetical protein [Pseudomonas synxantha]|uniref:Transmembrane protein n=1 Tax=Pseudomonas synxantha TaxID=47883 RepID=A0A5D3GAY5_9PSED|nr:hypothetical protein [Pseudomonas synxantha]TYK57260.1 hypothetical protein FXO26_16180 [Pseudomonas synxantha]